MKKQEILQLLDVMPEDLDPEQLMYELYIKAKLDHSEEAIARGEVVSHDEVVQRHKQLQNLRFQI